MPPKKKQQNKQQGQKADKTIEDKTFGLKNKKGKKQPTFIAQVTSAARGGAQKHPNQVCIIINFIFIRYINP